MNERAPFFFSLHYFSFFRCIINSSLSLNEFQVFSRIICFSFKIIQSHPFSFLLHHALILIFHFINRLFIFKHLQQKSNIPRILLKVIFTFLWNLPFLFYSHLTLTFFLISLSALNIIKVTFRFSVKFKLFLLHFSLFSLF